MYSWYAYYGGYHPGLLAARRTREEILDMYPYLEDEDISAALNYATLLANDRDLPIGRA